MRLVTNVIDPAELTAFVRELDFAEFTLNQFLPDQVRPTVEWAFDRRDQRREDMASYRAFDVEAEIGSRPSMERIRGAIPPLSRKLLLGEEQRLRLNQLANGGGQTGPSAEMINAAFDDAAFATESILSRIEYARGQVLSTGKVTFTNDEGFVAAEIDYGIPGAHFTSVSTAWATSGSATPIADMRAKVDDYMTRNKGRRPAVALTSSTAISNALLTAEARAYAGVGGTIPSILTPAQLRDIFVAHDLPPLVAYDTQVSIGGVDTRVIPVDKVIFLPQANSQRFGETTFGVTAESLDLVGAGYLNVDTAPGLTGVVLKSDDPVQHWTKVSGIAVPVLKDNKAITVLDVAP